MNLPDPFSAIKSAKLPLDWSIDPQKTTAQISMLSCYAPIHEDVLIAFLRRKGSISPEAIEVLKATLFRPVHKIEDASQELRSLSPVLGHAGDNQWTNADGPKGSGFRLLQAETMRVRIRTLLFIRGTFLSPQDRKGINEYCGIFLDVPKDNTAVEELFVQVPCQLGIYQFEQYRKVFMQVVESLEFK